MKITNVFQRMNQWIILAVLAGFVSFAFGEEDWQYWSTWSATHKLSDKSSVSALAEVYFRDDMSDDYVYDEYLTYARRLGSGFGFVCQAYFESVEKTRGEWTGTRSAVAGPTYTVDITGIGKLKLEDRFFYRVNSAAGWDYHRPRIYLSRDIGPVTLMLSDEMRVDLSNERAFDFFRNRIYATVLWKKTDNLTLGLGYLRQSDRANDGDWSSFNGLQSVVNVSF
jgi:hypothetical protein